jgi:predicted P-loop ATPase
LRDQLWAEAYTLYRSGEKHWIDDVELLDEAKRQQEERVQQDPWHEQIEDFVAGHRFVRSDDIMKSLGIETAKRTRVESARISRVMSMLGWEKAKAHVGGKQVRCYKPKGRGSLCDDPTPEPEPPHRATPGQLFPSP